LRGFSAESHYERLAAIHNHIQESGGLLARNHRFFIEAQKPI
jgi:hypothetical protein